MHRKRRSLAIEYESLCTIIGLICTFGAAFPRFRSQNSRNINNPVMPA
jgi:hypothetical protein